MLYPNAPARPALRTLLLVLGLLLTTRTAHAQLFTDAGAGLTGIAYGSVAWGDVDDDGDLDLVVSGLDGSSASLTKLYRNTGGTFAEDLASPLAGAADAALAWGDYDNDGDLDLALSGGGLTKLYRNTGGTLAEDTASPLVGASNASLAWGDYDNDGDLDLVVAGRSGTVSTRLYRNTGGTFTDAGAGLAGAADGALAWGDYDNDGDLDLALSGLNASNTPITKLYANQGGTFIDAVSLPGVERSALAWGDYDNDGDLDLVAAGYNDSTTPITNLYRNDAGAFVAASAGLTGVRSGALAWGDYDNDGDLDLVVAGLTAANARSTKLYRNDAGAFTDAAAGLTGAWESSVAWGDYDADGDLDLLLSGLDASSNRITTLYRNNALVPNTVPGAPAGLSATATDDGAVLGWTAATDLQTPSGALSYNLIIGLGSLSPSARSPMACRADTDCGGDGFRKVAAPGNAGGVTNYTIRGLAPGTYSWSVQAVDHAFAGSPFATEGSFTIAVPPFTDAAAGLTGVEFSALAWGDYDDDGDLDLALSGALAPGSGHITRLYENDGGTFTDAGAGLTGVENSALAWGDYDNDGDLDLVVAGFTGSSYATTLYENDGGTFTDAAAGLTGVAYSALAWGDYDNDGDLDLVVAGYDGSSRHTTLYENDGGTFTDAGAGLTGVENSALAWGDYDNDGDLDLVVAGYDGSSRHTTLYENDGGSFTDAGAGLSGVSEGSLAWGDYDADGDLDLVVAGFDGTSRHATLYENDGGTFTDAGAGLTGVENSALAWGDYDNDGDLDLVVAGFDGTSRRTTLYENDGGSFTDAGAGLTGVENSALAWGDYDNDGDLDLALSGYDSDFSRITKLYRNNATAPNTVPAAPTGLSATATDDGAVLAWTAATDGETPSAGLSYNLIVGTASLSPGIKSPMACRADTGCGGDGYRKVVALGNANGVTGYTIKGLAPGTYSWSVQAVDHAFAGSPFADEGSFTVAAPPFTEDPASPPAGVSGSALAWGDYDDDGDLDLLVAGEDGSGNRLTTLYRNDAGTFTDAGAGLTGVVNGALAWGDYDADGDLDLVVSGYINAGRITTLYRNDGGAFIDAAAGLVGVGSSAVAWGDYDNDGDLDLVVSGLGASSIRHTTLYRNDAGAFIDAGAGLVDLRSSAVAWGDYDDDGDLDLALAGLDASNTRLTKLYRNDAGTFTDTGAGLVGVWEAALAWGDYDNDGDLDLLVAGDDGTPQFSTKLYENDGGTFTDAGAGLVGTGYGSVAWGDYDNDGDLDLALTGGSSPERVTRLYENDGGTFTDVGAGFPGLARSAVAWGDVDNDGDLDLVVSGLSTSGSMTTLYTNNALVPNTVPAAPTGLSATATPDGAVLAWSAATDGETPPDGLSYNLVIGTAPLSPSVRSPMACRADADCGGDGYRKVVELGNAHQVTGYAIKGLAPGTYFWSVQAVDHAFAGSPFATEGSFTVGQEQAPLEVTLTAKKPPVVLSHRGGKFAFNLKVKNVSDTKQRFQGWFVVTYPDGREVVLTTGIRAVLQPGRHRGWLGELKVPGSAPSGTYRFTGRVGTFPDEVVAEDWIPFVKNPPAGGKVDETGELITAWQVVDEATGLAFVTVEEEVEEEAVAEETPSAFSLSAAYPNPFNPSTEIGFSLPEQVHVRLVVYDALGREVARLVDGVVEAGVHGVRFEAGGLPSGVYLYRLEAGAFAETRRMLLLK